MDRLIRPSTVAPRHTVQGPYKARDFISISYRDLAAAVASKRSGSVGRGCGECCVTPGQTIIDARNQVRLYTQSSSAFKSLLVDCGLYAKHLILLPDSVVLKHQYFTMPTGSCLCHQLKYEYTGEPANKVKNIPSQPLKSHPKLPPYRQYATAYPAAKSVAALTLPTS